MMKAKHRIRTPKDNTQLMAIVSSFRLLDLCDLFSSIAFQKHAVKRKAVRNGRRFKNNKNERNKKQKTENFQIG